jgi:LysR family nitrogen assimilation transcriptional regulator
MNLASCLYLIRIAEHGSLSSAAIVLGVTQSTLSRAVREMESELGAVIFHRDGRGVVLTDEGAVVLEAARSVTTTLASLHARLEAMSGVVGKAITVGIMPSTALLLTVPLMSRLRTDFPGTQMQIVEGSTGHLLEWLSDGRLDLAVIYDSSSISRFNPEPVLTNDLHLVAARNAPGLLPEMPFASLASFPLVLQSRKHSTRRELDHLASEHGVKLNVVVEADSLTAITQLVSSGLACGILPRFVVDPETMQSAVVVDPAIERTICLATPLGGARAKGVTRIIRSFRDEIRSVYRGYSRQPAT